MSSESPSNFTAACRRERETKSCGELEQRFACSSAVLEWCIRVSKQTDESSAACERFISSQTMPVQAVPKQFQSQSSPQMLHDLVSYHVLGEQEITAPRTLKCAVDSQQRAHRGECTLRYSRHVHLLEDVRVLEDNRPRR